MQCGSWGFCIKQIWCACQMQFPGLHGYLILSILKAEPKTRTWCKQEAGKVRQRVRGCSQKCLSASQLGATGVPSCWDSPRNPGHVLGKYVPKTEVSALVHCLLKVAPWAILPSHITSWAHPSADSTASSAEPQCQHARDPLASAAVKERPRGCEAGTKTATLMAVSRESLLYYQLDVF